MLKTRVIPCLLLSGWNLVKTIQFNQKRIVGNPVQYVKVFNARNVDELVILDIDAPRNRTEPQYEVIADLSKECFMPLAVGGGISSLEHIRRILLSGADKIVVNSHSFRHPEFITESAGIYGSQCIVVSIDVKKNPTYEVFIDGGQTATGTDPVTWAQETEKRGAGELLLTSIDCDGKMQGFDNNLIKLISQHVSIPVIACGGAGTEDDFVNAVKKGEAQAIAAASIFLYTHITPQMVKIHLKQNGINTRC